ncbi:MAG: class I SAM-dependent methyltransferase [Betaproteobacteria bacterium]|nr:class I SAM-dependent methyltransferase [Betaproteobacteria bacterium]
MMNERTPRTDPEEALRGDITHGAFSHPLLKEVMRQFGRTAFGRSSACMEFDAFLRRIGARGKTCLEIGTMHGITAILLAQYFRRVVCVSVDRAQDRGLKHEIVRALGITNITFHDVENNAEKAKVISGLDFDFCYSDGDHARDARADFELVRRCGRVLFHEYWPIQPPVWNLVNELPPEEVTRAQFDCFAYWGGKPWSD